MAESETSGEARVDEPVDDPIDTDPFAALTPGDAPPPDPDGRAFDAFDTATWNFKPAPVPWHRTRRSVIAMVAVSVAVIALVVSLALLASRGPSGDEPPATGTSTVPTTATTPVTTSPVPPPLPPPPPPPPPPTASEIQRAPVIVRTPRPTKKPEINVTRSPMSVSPQKPARR